MVYAGFWRRFGAYWLDYLFIVLPLMILTVAICDLSRAAYLIWAILTSFIGLWYHVYLVVRYGATPGKLVLNMRLAMVDGASITLKAALIRYSVLFVLGLLSTVGITLAISGLSDEMYFSVRWMARQQMFLDNAPHWFKSIQVATQVWVWSEFISMLFNKKRRALHDFMAGTVVIRTEKPVASESV